jgi:hypothetical protein
MFYRRFCSERLDAPLYLDARACFLDAHNLGLYVRLRRLIRLAVDARVAFSQPTARFPLVEHRGRMRDERRSARRDRLLASRGPSRIDAVAH